MAYIDPLQLASVNYLIRERYYGTALRKLEIDKGGGSDVHLLLLKAYCLSKLGNASDALRLLNPLRKSAAHTSHLMAILFAIRIAHYAESTIDRESVEPAEKQIQQLWAAEISPEGAYSSAWLLLFEGAVDKAKSLVDRLETNLSAANAALKGWVYIVRAKGDAKVAIELFDGAIAIERWADAYMGKAEMHQQRRDAVEMKRVLEEAISAHPSFIPAYLEHMKASMMLRDWGEVLEVGQKASLVENDFCPIQLLYELTYASAVQSNAQSVEQILVELLEIVTKAEGPNSELNFHLAAFLLSLYSTDHPSLIEYARRLLDKALTLYPAKGEFLLLKGISLDTAPDFNTCLSAEDSGRLSLLGDDVKQALQLFMKAVELGTQRSDDPLPILCSSALFNKIIMKLANSSVAVECYLKLGNEVEARKKMDFVKTTHKGVEQTSRYHYLAYRLSTDGDSSISSIRQCVDLHMDFIQRLPFGLDFMEKMDVPYLIEIATFLLDEVPLTPSTTPNARVGEAERALQFLCSNCPGISQSAYLLAKVKFLCGDMDSSESILRACIDRNSSGADAYLLLARILTQKQDSEEAAKLLDMGLGYNFKLRDHPFYYLTKARLEKRAAKVEQSVSSLKAAMELPQFKKTLGGGTDMTETDIVSVYLELIDSLQMLNRMREADELMQTAKSLFSAGPEGEQLLIMNAKLQLQRGNADGALSTLQSVKPHHSNYQEAQIIMANIYLTEKRDKQKFAQCYRLILDKNPSAQAFELLGDAMMSIQEPTSATEAYETAMRRNPRDHRLAEKIGDAYVKCHLYNRAITFYETAMKQSGRQNVLRIRFAEQLYKMGNNTKCMKVLKDVLDEEKDPSDIQTIRDHVAYWRLLSRLHLDGGEWGSAVKDLSNAHRLQLKLLKDGKKYRDQSISLLEERKTAASICSQLAKIHADKRDWNRAIELYKEATLQDDRDSRNMLSLANVYISAGKVNECNQLCQKIVSTERDPQLKTDATLLLADMMYQRNEGLFLADPPHLRGTGCVIFDIWHSGDEALKHFSRILDANPKKALRNAVENNSRSIVNDAGYNYCKGLVEWYGGEPNNALQSFNRAKRDASWGEKAIYNMIEICLNPDNEIMGSEELDPSSHEQDSAERDVRIKTAERFLKELEPRAGMSQRYQLVQDLILVSSANKAEVQKALNNFLTLDVCKVEGGNEIETNLNVGALYGSARAYISLKQVPKAKAQLKRTINYQWSLSDADYLQQCWLLLADIYLNQGKGDQAMAILRTVLAHNASSAKALECMGFLCERDQKYADAAANYESAWRMCRKRNPAIGYKLAYNYFKCHRLFECIEVCHHVLQQYPSYPKIKKEILDKARANIRI